MDTQSNSTVSLAEHLGDLRKSLLYAGGGFFLVFICLIPVSNELYALVATPLLAVLPEGASMIAVKVTSPLFTPIKLAAFVGFLIAAPWIFWQLWRFVSPGLYPVEKRVGVLILASMIILFYCGIAFAFYGVFPILFAFFQSVVPQGVSVSTDISYYLDFVLQMCLVFGLIFETPVVVVILVSVGVVSTDTLSRARPWIILGAVLLGMILTPPDVISQILLALPMWILFEAGVIAAKLFIKKPVSNDTSNDTPIPKDDPSS